AESELHLVQVDEAELLEVIVAVEIDGDGPFRRIAARFVEPVEPGGSRERQREQLQGEHDEQAICDVHGVFLQLGRPAQRQRSLRTRYARSPSTKVASPCTCRACWEISPLWERRLSRARSPIVSTLQRPTSAPLPPP